MVDMLVSNHIIETVKGKKKRGIKTLGLRLLSTCLISFGWIYDSTGKSQTRVEEW